MSFSNDLEKISYALGMNVCEQFMHMPIKVDFAALQKGVAAYSSGKDVALSPEEYRDALLSFQKMMQEAEQKMVQELTVKNREAEDKFLAENGAKNGVITTGSGLQYEVLTEGSGDNAKADSNVTVHYTGTLLDGTVFDSSVKRGTPATFGVNQVIPGWTEALQLMNKGSKYKLYIPARLAYGDRGAGEMIQPGSTLIFEVELLDIM